MRSSLELIRASIVYCIASSLHKYGHSGQLKFVIPANAGIQCLSQTKMDSRLRGNEGISEFVIPANAGIRCLS